MSSYSSKYRAVTRLPVVRVRGAPSVDNSRRAEARAREEVADGLRERRGLGLGEPGVVGSCVLAHAAARRHHERRSRRHGFERRNPERLARIRMQHDVRVGVAGAQRASVGNVTEEMDADWRAPQRLLQQPGPKGPVPGEHEPEALPPCACQGVERVEEEGNVLLAAEAPRVEQQHGIRFRSDLPEHALPLCRAPFRTLEGRDVETERRDVHFTRSARAAHRLHTTRPRRVRRTAARRRGACTSGRKNAASRVRSRTRRGCRPSARTTSQPAPAAARRRTTAAG